MVVLWYRKPPPPQRTHKINTLSGGYNRQLVGRYYVNAMQDFLPYRQRNMFNAKVETVSLSLRKELQKRYFNAY
jgi:hypothetical protein